MRSFLVKLIVFAAFMAVALEVFFRTVVPAAQMPAGYQDPVARIMALDSKSDLEGSNTLGRLGRPTFRWHINNYGFNSAIDYKRPADRNRPCVVVIGNSYTQGLYSDVRETLAGRLQTALGDAAEVYNLGASGMPLSQCPLVVRFAQAEFDPALIIIQAGSGSLVRSIRSTGVVPYCQQYAVQGDTLNPLPPSRFQVNRKNRILRKSALVRYLFYNVNLNLGGGDVVQAAPAKDGDANALGGVPSEVFRLVMDRVLEEIAVQAPETPLLLVFDADRNAMYSADAMPPPLAESPFVASACAGRDVPFLDLTSAFWSEFEEQGKPFNFTDNYHWNPYGVEVVSRAIMAELDRLGLAPTGG